MWLRVVLQLIRICNYELKSFSERDTMVLPFLIKLSQIFFDKCVFKFYS